MSKTSPMGGLMASELRFAVRGQALVDDVSLAISPGEMIAIYGPSGSGKTTLLSMLGGVIRPDSGSVSFEGELLGSNLKAAQGIGIVLQGYGLVPVLTAAENVEVAMQARGASKDRVKEAAVVALGRVLLDGLGDRLVEQLSGGQQQRVAVARALVHLPGTLLADEPTSELDESTRDHVVEQFRREAQRGAVVVLATHDTDVMAACDRSLKIVAGRLVSV